jgi:hypothetical protein
MPHPGIDPDQLTECVDRVALPEPQPWHLPAVGLVHLRAGRFDVTIQSAEPSGPFAVFHNFMVALAHARAGNREAALPAFEAAMATFRKATAEDPDSPKSTWRRRKPPNLWLWLNVLHREALRELDPDQWEQLYGATERTTNVDDN